MDNIELNVLIIDDENDHVKMFRSKARKKKIKLNQFRNFEEGFKELKKNFNDYHGVILDAKCFTDKEAEQEGILSDDDIDAVSHNVRDLTESEGYIPHCINTGYSSKFKRRLENQGFEVFAKPQENDDVLEYIRPKSPI